jgi:hypothetical protein
MREESMGVNPYHYTAQTLTETLECLATHPGDVRERLLSAHGGYLSKLTASDFPVEHRKDWQWVMHELTKFEPRKDTGEIAMGMGTVECTMRRIRRSTGSKIAKKLYELYWVVTLNTQYQ